MSFISPPTIDLPAAGSVSAPASPAPARSVEDGYRTASLLLEVGNADPTGEIMLCMDSAGSGNAVFESGPTVEPGVLAASGPAPEFVAIDPRDVVASIGAGRDCNEVINFSLQLDVRLDDGVDALTLSVLAAPGTEVRALLDDGPAIRLDSGAASLPVTR